MNNQPLSNARGNFISRGFIFKISTTRYAPKQRFSTNELSKQHAPAWKTCY